ncbi:hypothetical protein OEW28_09405 [Defluviimonas sp. WL0002]|uniref:Transmembrane protein n=1 Tax=Albidovulum marisflavi TaxID=2984159 RepID=A0ABT2ZCG1_9RHOB|nr:hypothetical protein [Defluviimonas sp. WL0002]MCV2868843.1 hypothetical protein [Defluviimonas sp. WL0002]
MRYPRIIDDGSVWIVIVPPLIWALHFLAAYWIAAVWCAREAGSLTPAAWSIIVLTILALVAISLIGRVAAVRYGGFTRPGRESAGDTQADRRQFLGHVALLLCVLNAAAVMMTAIPSVMFGRC